MSTDDLRHSSYASHPPHVATLLRPRTVQPKLANERPPHPATLPPVRTVQLKPANERSLHPATPAFKASVAARLDMGATYAAAVAQPMNKKKGRMRAGMRGKADSTNTAAKKQSKLDRSFHRLTKYRTRWIDDNSITRDKMREFLAYYSNGIRGHASEDGQAKEHPQTTEDCIIFQHWHEREYGWQ